MQTFLLQIMQTFDYRFNYDFRWDDTWEYSKITSRTSSGALTEISDRFAWVEAIGPIKFTLTPRFDRLRIIMTRFWTTFGPGFIL